MRALPPRLLGLLSGLCLAATLASPANAAGTVNIYSSRGENLIRPLLAQFTEQTGIKARLVTGKAKELIQRMRAEGRSSPADLLLTTDAGNLVAAAQAGLLSPLSDAVLEERIPSELRDPQGQWFGLSQRARVLVVSPGRTANTEPRRYEDLSDAQWEGRLCARSSNHVYNQSLLASLIHYHGLEAATEWARGVRANMVRKPQGNDRSQILAVAAGECDVAIVNSYYLGLMMNGTPDDQAAAAKVALRYPNQADRGAHVNVSGGGIGAHAPNRDNAVALLHFLSSDAAQSWYAQTNNEYPVVEGVPQSPAVESWGPFERDSLPVVKLGLMNADSVKAFDRAGWE